MGRRVLMLVTTLLAVLLLVAIGWVSRSTVVITAGGVTESILLPVGSGAIRWRADQSVVATAPALHALHGPVVTRRGSSTYDVAWYCHDRVFRETVSRDSINIACEGVTRHWRWHAPASTPVTTWPIVPRVAVTSDLEGDTTYFGAWARALGVIDSAGHWAYGSGHLVILGDAVDRGRWVYPLLWTLYRLDHEAQAAGGAVHVVLGNHEQYDLVGVTKDLEAEHHYAMRQIGPYHTLLDSSTVLGQWLRTRPVAVRIGATMFVHGGLAPSLAAQPVTLDSLNQWSRDFLAGISGPMRTREAQLGSSSVTQYRGLVMATDAQPRADDTQVQQVLDRFGVERVVIGHTEVDSIVMLHGGRVIDVNATLTGTRALTLEADTPRIVDIGIQRAAWREPTPRSRRFQLLHGADWRALLGVFAAVRR